MPSCPICHRQAIHGITSPHNKSGNANRPYYYCDFNHPSEWIAWADNKGIDQNNPWCHCRQPTRWNIGRDRTGWFECATKQCEFKRNPRAGNNQYLATAQSPPVWTPSSTISPAPTFPPYPSESAYIPSYHSSSASKPQHPSQPISLTVSTVSQYPPRSISPAVYEMSASPAQPPR